MFLLQRSPQEIIFFLLGLVIAITVHEFSHAAVAYRLGDPTAKLQGRLTLNPLSHLDPIGTLLLFIVGFGWGKPVPFDPFNLRNPKRDGALISFAGPFSNVVTAIAFVIPFWIGAITTLPALLEIGTLLQPIVFLNLVLAVFNLIPIHPLDGFKVLGGILPKYWYYDWAQMERFGIFFLLFLIFPIFGGRSAISIILGPVLSTIIQLLYLSPG